MALLLTLAACGGTAGSPGSPPARPAGDRAPRVEGPADAPAAEPPATYDVASGLTRLARPADVTPLRRRLREVVWGSGDLPSGRVVLEVERGLPELVPPSLRDRVTADRLVVRMDHGLTSVVHHFTPEESSGVVVLYHQGHLGGFERGAHTIEALLDAGHGVAALSMPLRGLNSRPRVALPGIGEVVLRDHHQLAWLERPLRFFLDPVVGTVDHVLEGTADRRVAMLGVSGGGWTTVLAAALDPRIARSYPVAASLPLPVRTRRDWGDWEQWTPMLYREVSYPELYVLGALGEGRGQLQVYNLNDPANFAGRGAALHADGVARRVDRLGAGSFRVLIDESSRVHDLAPAARRHVLRDLAELAASPPGAPPGG